MRCGRAVFFVFFFSRARIADINMTRWVTGPAWPKEDSVLEGLRARASAESARVQEIVSPILTYCHGLSMYTRQPEGEDLDRRLSTPNDLPPLLR